MSTFQWAKISPTRNQCSMWSLARASHCSTTSIKNSSIHMCPWRSVSMNPWKYNKCVTTWQARINPNICFFFFFRIIRIFLNHFRVHQNVILAAWKTSVVVNLWFNLINYLYTKTLGIFTIYLSLCKILVFSVWSSNFVFELSSPI